VTSPTACSPSPRTAQSTKSAIGSGLKAACPPATTTGCVSSRSAACSGDAGEVEGLEQVGVAELGGEADAEDVEVADGAVGVDGELADAGLAHEGREVGPDGVGALGQGVGALVEHLVEDHEALVGQPHLVGVGVHQRPVDGDVVPGLDLGVQLAADVLDGLLHLGQQGLETGVQALSAHDRSRVDAGHRDRTVRREAPLGDRIYTLGDRRGRPRGGP
jgi:hypothetical protein